MYLFGYQFSSIRIEKHCAIYEPSIMIKLKRKKQDIQDKQD